MAEQLPKISIITVNYNQGKYLEECMLSVISQNYPNLEYIIIDGGSTDNSLNIIKKYEDKIAYWESGPDEGFYHAIDKGLKQSTGEIMGWLNSDDKLHTGALYTVSGIFRQFPNISWITGKATEYTDEGMAINRIELPWCRWSKYRYLTYDFQFIQQEATYWRRELWEKAGGYIAAYESQAAADMELWARFFRHSKLYTAAMLIGGFRHRNDAVQKSKAMAELYMEECIHVVKREISRLPKQERRKVLLLKVLGKLLAPFFFYDIPVLSKIYPWLMDIPPVIHYDFTKLCFNFIDMRIRHPPILIGKKSFYLSQLFKK